MAGTTPILSLEYHISREDFTAYSTRSMERQYALRARRANRSGTVKLAVGLIAAVYVGWAVSAGVISRERGNTPAILFAAALLVYGAYSFCYYRYLFPWLVKRNAREGYESSSYLQNPVKLDFTAGGFTETSEGKAIRYRWDEVKQITLEDEVYQLHLREAGRTLLIPRHSIGEEKYLLDEVLEGAAEKFGIGMEKQ